MGAGSYSTCVAEAAAHAYTVSQKPLLLCMRFIAHFSALVTVLLPAPPTLSESHPSPYWVFLETGVPSFLPCKVTH